MLSREELLWRADKIGASESAIPLGWSPFVTPSELVAQRVKLLAQAGSVFDDSPPPIETEVQERGDLFQSVLIEKFRRDHPEFLVFESHPGDKTGPFPGTFVHPEHRWLHAKPDALVCSRSSGSSPGELVGPLECKTANRAAQRKHGWGPAGGKIPKHVLAQNMQQQEIVLKHFGLKAVRGFVIVMCGMDDFREYEVPFNPGLIASMIEINGDFLRRYILTKTPPPPDSSKTYGQTLAHFFPPGEERKDTLEATPGDIDEAGKLRSAMAESARAEALETTLRNRLRLRIEEAGVKGMAGVLPDGEAFNLRLSTVNATNYEAAAREAGATPGQIAEFQRTDWKGLCDSMKVKKAILDRHKSHQGAKKFTPTFGD